MALPGLTPKCLPVESFQEALAIIEDEDDNYVELPDQYEINEYNFMEEFCFEIAEPKTRSILQRAIQGKGAFRRFKDTIHNLEIQDDWYAYRDQKLKEIAAEWCEDHQIEYIDDAPAKKVNTGEQPKGTLPETAGRKTE